jgi:hypothetical protein
MTFRMRKFFCLSALAALAVGLSACAGFMPERFGRQQPAAPTDFSAAPPMGDPVGDPLTDNPGQNVAELENAPGDATATGPQTSNVQVGRTDLLGGWKVAAGSDNCELFMTLTGWAGGYRATTKGCASAVLANVQAWNLNDNEVILISGGGETVATLYATARERFNGQTGDGIGITVYR